MLIFEILTLVVWIAFIVNGFRAGGVETLGRVIGALLGYLIAKAHAGLLIGILALILPKSWANFIAFLAIFLIVNQLVGYLFKIAGRLLHLFTKLPILKQVDSLIGGFLGFIEGIIVIGGISWLAIEFVNGQSSLQIKQGPVTEVINSLFNSLIASIL